MNLKIAICDDEENQIESIESILREWSRENGMSITVCTFQSAESFLFDYEENKD